MNARPPSRVLVTRAEPGASATGRRLAALGYLSIIEPLFTLEPIKADLPRFDVLAFTSANGVRAFARLSSLRDAPVFCVGRRTADAARDAGFENVSSAEGDVTALLALIKRHATPDASVLHAGNEESRGDLAGALKAAGRDAHFRALYRARPANAPGPALADHLLNSSRLEAVLVHSPRAATILAGFLAGASNPTRLAIAAISPQAASALIVHASRLEIATSPDEKSLLLALERLVSQG